MSGGGEKRNSNFILIIHSRHTLLTPWFKRFREIVRKWDVGLFSPRLKTGWMEIFVSQNM
jgi:hypothetical protein